MIHLISDKLVELVEKHSKIIIKRWTARLVTDPTTSSYSIKNIKYVEAKAQSMLEGLGRWVSYETTKEEIGKRFAQEGKDLFDMNIPLCEALRAMYTLRRTLWLFVENESLFDSALQLHQMMELSDRVILFFDRAEYYIIRGYMEEMHKKMKDICKLNPEDANKIFFEHSFYNK
ncbi:MAG: hypothetical protein JXA07_06160 [Spirochaetes bacterium]|nr:hypothetical protein [Spirochaetota bacterium]